MCSTGTSKASGDDGRRNGAKQAPCVVDAAVASQCAKTDAFSFQQHEVVITLIEQAEGGRQPCKATPDDDDVGRTAGHRCVDAQVGTS
jgi:flavin reductase (DIM6/NTAB) family NADH-FMN oxidoreductase RutF